MGMRRTNNFPESGRGLGHVTPTIFGSTVGYPSDSLASCYIYGFNCSYVMSDVSVRPSNTQSADHGKTLTVDTISLY